MFNDKFPDTINVRGDIYLNETKKALPCLKTAFEKLKGNEKRGQEAWKELLDEAITNNDDEMTAALILYRYTISEYADECRPKRDDFIPQRTTRNKSFYETISKCCDKFDKANDAAKCLDGMDIKDYRFSHVLFVLDEKYYGLAIKDGEIALSTFIKSINTLQDEVDAKFYGTVIDVIDSCCPEDADYKFKRDVVRYLHGVI